MAQWGTARRFASYPYTLLALSHTESLTTLKGSIRLHLLLAPLKT
jgi:hypothetical protein